MKKTMQTLGLLFCLASSLPCLGNIIETEYITDLVAYADKDHLIVSDINNVLITRTGTSSMYRPVEPAAIEVVRLLQKEKIYLVGLTAQHPRTAAAIHDHLLFLGIDLSANQVRKNNFPVKGYPPAEYIDGIIFCGTRNDKGKTLKEFLKQAQLRPQRVVFIDDNLKNVKAVEKAMKKARIPFTGLHYVRTN